MHRTNSRVDSTRRLPHAFARTLSISIALNVGGLSSYCRKTVKGGEETRRDPFTHPFRQPPERGLTSALSCNDQRRSARLFHATTPSRPHRQPTSTSTLLSFASPLVSRCHDFPSSPIEAFSSFLICPFSSGASSPLLPPLPLDSDRPTPQNSNNLQPTAVALRCFFCPIKNSRVKVRRARVARVPPEKYFVCKFLTFHVCIFRIVLRMGEPS